jgi:hypothetical protein
MVYEKGFGLLVANEEKILIRHGSSRCREETSPESRQSLKIILEARYNVQ